jgi:S-methylmethionine-dependent homocysteine/selenocysteine methylase
MNALSNAVAVVFPGVNSTDIQVAATAHAANILVREPYNEQKDYTKFFKRSKRVITTDSMNLLFIFSDGEAAMVKDVNELKKALKRAAIAAGAFA